MLFENASILVRLLEPYIRPENRTSGPTDERYGGAWMRQTVAIFRAATRPAVPIVAGQGVVGRVNHIAQPKIIAFAMNARDYGWIR